MVRGVVDSPQVNFYVEDVEASTRFYRESFGFTETFRTPQHGRPIHVELRLGQFTLGLVAIDSLRELHGIAAGPGGIAAGPGRPRAELVVWADDVDRVHADLAANRRPNTIETWCSWNSTPTGSPPR
jgi:catechol 2,3-dioxygenase-like lactoylglutathione lyase family enzyme